MKQLLAVALLATSGVVCAQQYVDGYCRSDGRCVQGHFRSNANGSGADNYGAIGNQNPNTGRIGTRKSELPNTGRVSDGHVFQVGPRGGEYYVSESGRRVYRKKD